MSKRNVSSQRVGTATVDRHDQPRRFGTCIKSESHCDPSLPDKNAEVRPELCLVLSIIQLAILDAISPPPQPRDNREVTHRLGTRREKLKGKWLDNQLDARAWILGDGRAAQAQRFSFEWCCESVGIMASDVRRRVRVTLGLLNDATVMPYTRESLCI